jgi:hypothetical protein
VTHILYKLGNETNSTLMTTKRGPKLYKLDKLLKRHLQRHETWYSTMETPLYPQHYLLANPIEGVEQILNLIGIVDDQWKRYGNGSRSSDIGGFLWEIPVDPYQLNIFDDQIRVAMVDRNISIPPSFPGNLSRLKKGCQYISKGPSIHVEEVVHRVWNQINDPTSTFRFFHIRRGDAIAQCNTTIPRLRNYLKCTFANTTKYGNITILLVTDETDPSYLGD